MLEEIERNCAPLTDIQKQMMLFHFKNKSLIGYARAIGRSVYFPAVQRGPKAPVDVIDACGYEQTAAKFSLKLLT